MAQAQLAKDIATEAHKGQVDKAGRDYREHLARVASRVSGDTVTAVAWLHDTLEDTDLDSLDLLIKGVSAYVVRSVRVLTRNRSRYTYLDYIRKIRDSGDADAIVVKIADLHDHLEDTSSIPDSLVKRYERALKILS